MESIQSQVKKSRKTRHEERKGRKLNSHRIYYSRNQRILIVGDGNFSFTLSLACQLDQRGTTLPRELYASFQADLTVTEDKNDILDILATSYDSETELLSKYPGSGLNLAQIRALGVRIIHGAKQTTFVINEQACLRSRCHKANI